jgi:diadenosine tetraphosphatase ApaH/serine/threonine PP2A family protein phosphatase
VSDIRAVWAMVCALVVGSLAVVASGLADAVRPCEDVTMVFARGSGQGLNEREAPVFFGHVERGLGPAISVTRYELGAESHGGARYPAAGGWRDMLEAEASWTGFLGGRYRASVAAGVTELTNYLTERAVACPFELFVLGGYSQGAQVAGEALFELDAATRNRVAFVALFSDPKLYLPEGRGPFPPACRGDESPWRRGSVGCWTDHGVLEARVPYLPKDIEDRTGSWCDRDDGVCSDSLVDLGVHDDHAEYADSGAEIDEAAREIVARLDARIRD